MAEKKTDKTKALTVGVVVLLVFFFVGGIILGLNNVLAMEGTYPPAHNVEGKSPAPSDAETALAYLDECLDIAVEGRPKVETDASFDIDADTIETDGSEQFKACLAYVRDGVDGQLEDSFDKPSVGFFEDCSELIRRPGLTADSVEEFSCRYFVYKCSSCGEEYDEPADNCDKCGSEDAPLKTYKDKYCVTLDLKNTPEVLNACFEPRSNEECAALVEGAINGKAAIKNLNVDYDRFEIYYEVDRLTDEIKCLKYTKWFAVDTDVTFVGDWSKFSGGKVGFEMKEDYNFIFTWPGLSLSDYEMTVEPRNGDNLLAFLVHDEAEDYVVKWESSDPALVEVDDEGYFKAGKETGSAVITASFEFGGKTYSDECTINVRHPVEGLKMKPKKVSLKVGEEKSLNVKVSPNKATVKELKWYTRNADIATVDSDGVIHAVAPGKVQVYCLSVDGYYKSTCEVTVK